jgi:tellurium resistance protein TerZ
MDSVSADREGDPNEIVMGLHWHPQEPGARAGRTPANLDASCVLFDEEGRVVEVVHPGRPSNANGSVLHTGDSRTGASEWDDERIFVFLEALPDSVSALAFVVASADGRVFSEVPGASCHVSDRITEREWIRLDLTALGKHGEHRVATLRRGPKGWQISPDAQGVCGPPRNSYGVIEGGEVK